MLILYGNAFVYRFLGDTRRFCGRNKFLTCFVLPINSIPQFNSSFPVVTVTTKCREVVVKGPLGTLQRSFKHISLDIQQSKSEDGKDEIKVDLWFGSRAVSAGVRTICSHIENMITGVTKGFKYKMRFCYAHFPINSAMVKNGANEVVEIRNYLGEKKVRRIELLEGVKYVKTADVKDQIEISGIDVTKVSLSCARINQACKVPDKDIRKFLDGIYVSERGTGLSAAPGKK